MTKRSRQTRSSYTAILAARQRCIVSDEFSAPGELIHISEIDGAGGPSTGASLLATVTHALEYRGSYVLSIQILPESIVPPHIIGYTPIT